MTRCWFSHSYVAYHENTDDGGYIHGITCTRCGDKRPAAKVSRRGAELQKELDELRKGGMALHGKEKIVRALHDFQSEVTRLT